jgi:polysaccharide deacetylase family protein (PEP-CTERM system associated)
LEEGAARLAPCWYTRWKPAVEFVLALIGLILTAPVILLAAVLIKVTSRGPAIYTQVRVGKNGRRFTIYKLRTMFQHAEAATGPVWSAPGDCRVSRIGKILRASHLDELPQLFNVLLGQMSLIGPRPERPEIVDKLRSRIANYTDRLEVRPGISGLAQVQLPPDVDLEGVRKKLVCDLYYIEHFSAGLEFRILVSSALVFLGIPLGLSRRWLRIPEPLTALESAVSITGEPTVAARRFEMAADLSDDSPPNVMSIDVEDYYHVANFEGRIERRDWGGYPCRVVANTRRLLKLLDKRQVRGTFFVLGWVGWRFPGLVREIVRAGHEVGCHSYWHRLVYEQTPEEFRQDLRMARDVLEDAGGEPVTAYRAPCYSITRDSLWALDILKDEGFLYDSSIFPTRHPRYGIPNARPFPHRLDRAGDPLWEFPPSVVRFLRMNMPVAGGGYFRLYPVQWTAFCFRQINRSGQPFVFNIHPWEIDPDQPRLARFGLSAFRHYLNLDSTEEKLDWLLGQFSFGSMSQVAQYCADKEEALDSGGPPLYLPPTLGGDTEGGRQSPRKSLCLAV